MTKEEIKPFVFRLLKDTAPEAEPGIAATWDEVRLNLEVDSFGSLPGLWEHWMRK